MFQYTKKKHTGAEKVWWNCVCIGEIQVRITERPGIDWQALRADKTLRLPHSERWCRAYTARLTSNTMVGRFEDKEEAANAILERHRELFKEEQTENE